MSTETANPFLTWAPPGAPVVIQLAHDVMDRMSIEVMRGFGVTRRRGTESGGVLLGKVDRRASAPVIQILDFEVVPCEYASGPSYVLSPADRQRFKEAVAKWQPSLEQPLYAVGFFRSHTRDGFALDPQDASVVREFFPDALDVALLVKPYATRAATAGFFLKEDGALVTAATPLEFKFEAPTGGGAALQAVDAPTAVPAATTPPIAPRSSKPTTTNPRPTLPVEERSVERDLFTANLEPQSPWLRRLSWALFCLALLGFGAACGYEYAGRLVQKQNAPAGTTPSGPGLPNADLYSVNLQASRSGNSVAIRWNRDAAPIQAALYGILAVTEGVNTKEVKLGFAELRNGSVLYPLSAREVRFRLEVYFKDERSFVESIVYMGAAQ